METFRLLIFRKRAKEIQERHSRVAEGPQYNNYLGVLSNYRLTRYCQMDYHCPSAMVSFPSTIDWSSLPKYLSTVP